MVIKSRYSNIRRCPRNDRYVATTGKDGSPSDNDRGGARRSGGVRPSIQPFPSCRIVGSPQAARRHIRHSDPGGLFLARAKGRERAARISMKASKLGVTSAILTFCLLNRRPLAAKGRSRNGPWNSHIRAWYHLRTDFQCGVPPEARLALGCPMATRLGLRQARHCLRAGATRFATMPLASIPLSSRRQRDQTLTFDTWSNPAHPPQRRPNASSRCPETDLCRQQTSALDSMTPWRRFAGIGG